MTKKPANTNLPLVLSAILIIAVSFILFCQTANASERVKPYYSGDAISYNGRLFIASTNMKGVEIFEVKNNKIYLLKSFSSFDAIYSNKSDFNDAVFKIEGGLLYLYLSDGRYIYKYDLADASNPILSRKIMDNSYDWFASLGSCDGNLFSQGTKGLKLWDNGFNVIYANNLSNSEPKNVQLDPACLFIFNVNGNQVGISNRFGNYSFPAININSNENHYRKILFDNNSSSFYLVDDWSLKQFDYQGKILQNFKHISKSGYDVVGSADQRYLYFSDGIGVVKSNKSDLQPVKWVYTTDLGGKNGWAMRLFAVKNNDGEKLIVFNNSNILVLDENLKKVDSYASSMLDYSPLEPVFISVNKSFAASGEAVSISGQGFVPREDIKISLGGNYFYTKGDDDGKFIYVMQIPPVKFGLYNLIAEGVFSKRTFSLSFPVAN